MHTKGSALYFDRSCAEHGWKMSLQCRDITSCYKSFSKNSEPEIKSQLKTKFRQITVQNNGQECRGRSNEELQGEGRLIGQEMSQTYWYMERFIFIISSLTNNIKSVYDANYSVNMIRVRYINLKTYWLIFKSLLILKTLSNNIITIHLFCSIFTLTWYLYIYAIVFHMYASLNEYKERGATKTEKQGRRYGNIHGNQNICCTRYSLEVCSEFFRKSFVSSAPWWAILLANQTHV